MEEMKYKVRWYYSLLVISLLIIVCVGFSFIIQDQTKMYKEISEDYNQSLSAVSELSNKIDQKNVEITELRGQIKKLEKQPK